MPEGLIVSVADRLGADVRLIVETDGRLRSGCAVHGVFISLVSGGGR
jgi:hypothetical protein